MNWLLYYFLIIIFFSCYSFQLTVYFVWYKYSYPCFVLVSSCIEYLSHPFTWSLRASLKLKWIPCRQHIVGYLFVCLFYPLSHSILFFFFLSAVHTAYSFSQAWDRIWGDLLHCNKLGIKQALPQSQGGKLTHCAKDGTPSLLFDWGI